jgi:hypothetical protein
VDTSTAVAVDDQLIGILVDRARAGGLQLTGEGGLLQQLTKRVLESALEGEMTDHRCLRFVLVGRLVDPDLLGQGRGFRVLVDEPFGVSGAGVGQDVRSVVADALREARFP